MFLSTSQYYDTPGLSYISSGAPTIPGGNFVFYNNGNNYGELFTNSWDATGPKPDWAVTANFTNAAPVPEPEYLALPLTVLLGTLAMVRKRLGRNAPTES